LNRPTFETIGRRNGTDTARTSTDRSVSFVGTASLFEAQSTPLSVRTI